MNVNLAAQERRRAHTPKQISKKKKKKTPGVFGGRGVSVKRERKGKSSRRIRYLHKIYTITRTPNKARRHSLSLSAAKIKPPRQPQSSDTYQRSPSKCFLTLAIMTRRRRLGIPRRRSPAPRSANLLPHSLRRSGWDLATHCNVSVIS